LDRGVYLSAVFLIISILILTQSRGALLAFLVVFLAIIILRWRRVWIGVICVLIVGIFLVYQNGFSNLLDIISYNENLQGLGGRVEIWSRAIYMIQDFPITGIGLGSFGKVADLLYPLFLFEPGSIPHAHNLFIQIAVDLGIPGLVSWMAILFVVIFSSWKLFRMGNELGDTWMAGLGAGLFASQIALVVHGLIDSVTWGMVRPAPLVWAIWGIAVVAWMGVRSDLDNFTQKSN
jgi:putative inorganic carbon (HCO3(-)) transporter